MRERWQRSVPVISPDETEITALVRTALPAARVTGFAHAEGGLANTNIRVDLADAPGRVLLRLYQRDASQAGKEKAIAERVGHAVPIPRFLHLGETTSGVTFAVLEWIEGAPLSSALEHAGRDATSALGIKTGTCLAHIHAFTFPHKGFLDADFTVPKGEAFDHDFMVGYLRDALLKGAGARFIDRDLATAVIAYAEQNREAVWPGPPRLIHCDFNGANILVRDGEIAAVLDWEFAFSGTPAIDFGNLIRNHPDRAFQDAVARGYAEAGGVIPDDWRKLARLVDMTAWADFLQRPEVDPVLAEDARRCLAETIAED